MCECSRIYTTKKTIYKKQIARDLAMTCMPVTLLRPPTSKRRVLIHINNNTCITELQKLNYSCIGFANDNWISFYEALHVQ